MDGERPDQRNESSGGCEVERICRSGRGKRVSSIKRSGHRSFATPDWKSLEICLSKRPSTKSSPPSKGGFARSGSKSSPPSEGGVAEALRGQGQKAPLLLKEGWPRLCEVGVVNRPVGRNRVGGRALGALNRTLGPKPLAATFSLEID